MSIIIVLVYILQIYSFILLARVLMTWIPNLDYRNPIVRFLLEATEPLLKPIRNAMPPRSGLDFSPIILFLGIFILTRVLLNFQ